MKLSHYLTFVALVLTMVSAQAQAPVITGSSPTSPAALGSSYSFTYTFTGTPAPVFSLPVGTTLPPGLTLSPAGVISGVPTSMGTLNGTGTGYLPYTGTVKATNSAGSTTQAFSIAVGIGTVPEAAITYSLSPGQSLYLSLPFTADPNYTGAVSSTIAPTANTIAVDDSPAWTANAFANLYFVKFLTGTEAGRVLLVTANTASSLTLDTTDNSTQAPVSLTTSGFSVAAGDSFEVFPADTLASVFGNNTSSNPLLLTGSTSVYTSDSVSFYSPTAFHWQTYFFNTSTTPGYWQSTASTANANNTILYPYGALTIARRSGETATTITLTGRVSEVAVLTKTTGNGVGVYSSTDYPVDMTLSQLHYDLSSSWEESSVSSPSPYSADTVSVWDAANVRFDLYYELTDSTWRSSRDSSTDQSSFVIPAGSFISIVHRSAASGPASFLPSKMPYVLPNTF